eukprot:m.152721 g.152721  ORF g.152721 m.152721 type:complete len:503 (+) comp30812_c0_seq1:359-1867(+)
MWNVPGSCLASRAMLPILRGWKPTTCLDFIWWWLVIVDIGTRANGALRQDEVDRCNHTLTLYDPPEDQRLKGHCRCEGSAVCVGTICSRAHSAATNKKVHGFITQCDDCMCVQEDVAAVQWSRSPGTERFVTFRWNAGRMGNQMMTVNYAFQVAHALERTVYVRCHRGGSFKDKVGLQPDNKGFWDIEHLAKKFSVAFDEVCGIPQSDAVAGVKIVSASSHSILSNPNHYCHEKYFLDQVLADKTIDDCFVLDLEGDKSVLWQSTVGFHEPIVFWQALRPVKLIRDFVQAKFDSTPMITPSFAVHHRNSIRESKRDEDPQVVLEMCTKYISSEGKKFGWNAGPPEEDGWMCTLTVDQVERILARGGVDIKLQRNSTAKWWLLDDFSLCNHKGDCPYLQNELFAHGAVVACTDPHWAHGWTCSKEDLLTQMQLGENENYTKISNYLSPVIDQWVAVSVDFHIGLVGSTFDEIICGMRGEAKFAQSNICVGWNTMRQAKAKRFI